jgi:small neutral amino acid transporter SnatA (MarC family)
MKYILIFLMCLQISSAEVPAGDAAALAQEPAREVNQRRKVLTQGCVIGGVVMLVAGLLGGWVLDLSNSSTNQNVKIDCGSSLP